MNGPTTRSQEVLIFLAITGLTLALSFAFVLPRHWDRGFLGPDAAWQADLARHVLAGDGYVSSTLFPMDAQTVDAFPVPEALKQSGLSLATAAVWWLFGESERSVILISMLAFALGVALTQLLTYRLTRHRGVALLVSGLVVANPMILGTMLVALPTSLVFMTFMLMLVLVVEPTVSRVAFAGLAYLLLLLAKGYAVLYLLPVVGALAISTRAVRLPLVFLASVLFWMVTAQAVLPEGSFRVVNSGSNYALAFLHEWWYPPTVYAYRDLTPPDPWAVIIEHPGQFAVHYARLASRTKRVLDVMAGPAVGGLLFPLLWLALLVLPLDRLRAGVLLPEVRSNAPPLLRDSGVLFLLASSVLMTFGFFWALSPRIVYWAQLYPVMLLLVVTLLMRFRGASSAFPTRGRRVVVGLACLYLLAYPLAVGFREVYTDPFAYLGRGLAVRRLDYGQMSTTLASWLPDRDAVVVSDMPNEISWWNRNPTIYFPLDEEQLRFLVERFDVQALYERPEAGRDWGYVRDHFRLVDSSNGRLWVRRAGEG